jgi:hypothetical protein
MPGPGKAASTRWRRQDRHSGASQASPLADPFSDACGVFDRPRRRSERARMPPGEASVYVWRDGRCDGISH